MPIGSILSAGAALIGGSQNRKAVQEQNRIQLEQAEKNRQMQLDFAQQGLRWKVADAKAAGIHPLYAVGAPTQSYSPVTVGTTADTSMGSAIAAAGQDLGRAVHSTRTAGERVSAVQATMDRMGLERAGLENDILRMDLASKVAKLRADQVGPPMPGVIPEDKLDNRTALMAGGKKMNTAPGWSDGSTFEDRWGDWGGSAAGVAVMINDLINHARSQTTVERAPWSWVPKIKFKERR